jgi:hypothetical protein
VDYPWDRLKSICRRQRRGRAIPSEISNKELIELLSLQEQKGVAEAGGCQGRPDQLARLAPPETKGIRGTKVTPEIRAPVRLEGLWFVMEMEQAR